MVFFQLVGRFSLEFQRFFTNQLEKAVGLFHFETFWTARLACNINVFCFFRLVFFQLVGRFSFENSLNGQFSLEFQPKRTIYRTIVAEMLPKCCRNVAKFSASLEKKIKKSAKKCTKRTLLNLAMNKKCTFCTLPFWPS